MSDRRCLRCLLQDFDRQAYIATLKERADPTEYAARLDACRACSRLERGLCLACGCYVELRAASRRGRCPYEKWPHRGSGAAP